MAGRKRGRETVADMVRSLGLVVVVVAVIAAVVALTLPDAEPVPDLDYAEVVETASRQAGFEPAAPGSLPDGWRVTSSRVRSADRGGEVWSLGLVTAGGDFVGLEQIDAPPADVEREQLGEYERDGFVTVAGAEWERWVEVDRSPDRALRRDLGGTTVVVVSSGGYGPAEELAALVPASG